MVGFCTADLTDTSFLDQLKRNLERQVEADRQQEEDQSIQTVTRAEFDQITGGADIIRSKGDYDPPSNLNEIEPETVKLAAAISGVWLLEKQDGSTCALAISLTEKIIPFVGVNCVGSTAVIEQVYRIEQSRDPLALTVYGAGGTRAQYFVTLRDNKILLAARFDDAPEPVQLRYGRDFTGYEANALSVNISN